MATISSQLYSSRDNIRSQLIEYLKSYLELENISLTKGSFLSYIINVISTLTSNLLFYESSVYNEFFLTKAKLSESVLNLASALGYNAKEASPAVAEVLITIPLTFTSNEVNIVIPPYHKFYANDIEFITYYTTQIYITNNQDVSIYIEDENGRQAIPVLIDTTSSPSSFSFMLNLKQMKISSHEFQIDENLQPYQFTDIDVKTSGNVANLEVRVTDPGGLETTLYEEFDSLFLMTSQDSGYVSRKTDTGRKIYFGNGLIGRQPLPGSNVNVKVTETLGSLGNVVAGSINRGDRIYALDNNITKVVDYSVINPIAAYSGKDEESIEEIRMNSITALTSLRRLVSENDYRNLSTIVEDFPFSRSCAVLKRSDLKVNEIQLYTVLEFNNEIALTRSAYFECGSDSTSIPRLSLVSIKDTEYYTLFDLYINAMEKVAYYEYIVNRLRQNLIKVAVYLPDVDIKCTYIDISKDELFITFEIPYESSFELTCQLTFAYSDTSYTMVTEGNKFILSIPSTSVPKGKQLIYFDIKKENSIVCRYSINTTIKQDLSQYMMSTITCDSTSIIIYDVPVIKKSYYDTIDQDSFESIVMQNVVSKSNLNNYRMLTDFINLKIANTVGSSISMKYNKSTKPDVIDWEIKEPPINPKIGDRYIIGIGEGAWKGKNNKIVVYTGLGWSYIDPSYNDIVYIKNKGIKVIFTGSEWVEAVFDIPLQIRLEVYKKTDYAGTNAELVESIKSKLISEFSDRFGLNIKLYRSEVISVVQCVEGVSHCTLVYPKHDIFFDFDLSDLTEIELLTYAPDYVYFREDDISVNIVS